MKLHNFTVKTTFFSTGRCWCCENFQSTWRSGQDLGKLTLPLTQEISEFLFFLPVFFFFLIVALTTCHVHGKKEVLKISNLIFMLNRSVFIDPRSFSCPGRPCRWAPNKENAGCIICWIAWYPQALYVHSMLYLEN